MILVHMELKKSEMGHILAVWQQVRGSAPLESMAFSFV